MHEIVPSGKRRSGLLISAIPLLLEAGCLSEAKDKPAPPPVPVRVARAIVKDVPVEITAIGRAEAYSTIEIKAQVGGELVKVHFKEGDEIRKGDRLFTIDPRPWEAAVRQAEANRARDQARLKNAEIEVGRIRDLLAKEYATKEQYDTALTDVETYQAMVQADEAALEGAKIQLGFCTIVSPIDGRLGELLLHQGNIVKANADGPMAVITQVQPMYVAFSVPEKHLPEIRKYLAEGKLLVEALIPNREERPVTGELTFIDNTVDSQTGTISLKATFPNEDRALWPGLFVDVHLHLTMRRGALVIPSQAVQIGQKGPYVFVIQGNGTAELRAVAIADSSGGETVLESGVKEGEAVVTEGHLRLFPGAKVEVREPEPRGGSPRP